MLGEPLSEHPYAGNVPAKLRSYPATASPREESTKNFRNWLSSISTGWMARTNGEQYLGIIFGVVADMMGEALGNAMRFGWLLDDDCPDDAVQLHGKDRLLPRYPLESAADYRQRVWNAWETYENALSTKTMEGQLDAAGLTGAKVHFDLTRTGPNGEAAPYVSQFWIERPDGTHPYSAATDVTAAELRLLRTIARKWKPSVWVCRGFIYRLTPPNSFEIAF